MKIRVVFLLNILFLLSILSGCVAPESTTTTMPTQIETPSTPTELRLKIGETAKLPGIEVTVISINKTDHILVPCFEHTLESEGKIFVVADVEIKNTGNKGIKFIDHPFEMIDSAGFTHRIEDDYPYTCYEGKLKEDDVYPDHQIRGKILFEIPTQANGLKIKLVFDKLYTPDFKHLPIEVKSVSWRLE